MKDPADPFIGRISELSELRWTLIDKKPVVLTGDAGVGKTEMAVKYAQEFKHDNHSSTIFIDSTSHQSLINSFKDLSIKIGVKNENKVILTMIRECVDYFSNRKTLFILDNCNTDNTLVKEIQNIVTPSGLISIILTSRDENWDDIYKNIKLHPFNKEESSEYIKKSLGVNVLDNHIEKLNSLFGFLPLTLNRAVVFIENRIILFPNKNMDEYIHDIEDNRKEIIIEKHIETVTRNPTEDEIQSFLLDKLNNEAKAIGDKVSNAASETWGKVSGFVSDKAKIAYNDGIKVAADKVVDVAKDIHKKFSDIF